METRRESNREGEEQVEREGLDKERQRGRNGEEGKDGEERRKGQVREGFKEDNLLSFFLPSLRLCLLTSLRPESPLTRLSPLISITLPVSLETAHQPQKD